MNLPGEPGQPAKRNELGFAAWEQALKELLADHRIYAPVRQWGNIDYELLTPDLIPRIVYNTPKPVSPLKLFLLPVKENVAVEPEPPGPVVVIGAPACDLWALDVLDKMYLGSGYVDPYYRARRENLILVGMDCHSSAEHCHCTSYGLNPFPEENHDLAINLTGDKILIEVNSQKGVTFAAKINSKSALTPLKNGLPESIIRIREDVRRGLEKRNHNLPNFQETTALVKTIGENKWKKHSADCVSCGACATICPTCTCFLLIDRPGFEKVKQMDACQYPGFQRVAGGEDPLKKKQVRFCNRYFCKYVWKPEKYDMLACTGCGRCIETCIARIDKNELFLEVSGSATSN